MKFQLVAVLVLSFAVSGFSQTNSLLSQDIFFRSEFRTTRLFGPGLNADLFYSFNFLKYLHIHAAAGMDLVKFQLNAYRLGITGTLDLPENGFMAGVFFMNQAFPQYNKAYNTVSPQVEARLGNFRLHGGLSLISMVNDTNHLRDLFYYPSVMFQLSYEIGVAYRLELFEKRYSIDLGFNNYEPLRVVYFSAFGLYADQIFRLDENIGFELYTGIRMTGSLDLTAQVNEFSCRAGVEITL